MFLLQGKLYKKTMSYHYMLAGWSRTKAGTAKELRNYLAMYMPELPGHKSLKESVATWNKVFEIGEFQPISNSNASASSS